MQQPEQPELFDWNDPAVFIPVKKVKRQRKYIDYDQLYKLLLEGPLTFRQIEEITGVSHCGVAQVITTLTLKYPVWSPKRGVYKLCEDTDYNGIKRRLLENEN